MVLPQFSVFSVPVNLPNQQQSDDSQLHSGVLDSITLGQLRSMNITVPKPKQTYYDFRYEDEDTVMNEIDEFYSYVEAPQVEENMKSWESYFTQQWTKSPVATRTSHIEFLLESLEHRNAEIRFTAARRLMYVLQGTFAETSSPEHQLHWIIENCRLVRSLNGLSTIVEALKIASSKHDLLSFLSDSDAERLGVSIAERAECIEEICTEISIYLGMMYLMIEVMKDLDDFSEELMSLDPPLPVFLCNMVSGLRDKSAKGYPMKKLLLVLWKSFLACCGGVRDINRVKKLARELSGLPPAKENDINIKSSPFDIQNFRQETSVKYPTFSPAENLASAPLSAESEADIVREMAKVTLLSTKLAQAYAPIPVRHHYHHGDEPDFHQGQSSQSAGYPHGNLGQAAYNQNGMPQYSAMPQAMTPMPTPPPSPKPKKQQYQTDQTRPFLFPFSRSQVGSHGYGFGFGSNRLVPFAIDEADKLYNKHMHISVSLLQMWRTREDCMIAESGLHQSPSRGDVTFESVVTGANEGTSAPSRTSHRTLADAGDSADAVDELPDIKQLDAKIAETDSAIKLARQNGEVKRLKELSTKKEDLKRLRRVEQIYSSVLPTLPGLVLVLLKLLLAAVSASNPNQPPPSASSAAFPPGAATPEQQPPMPPPTLDEIDVIRHREITSKAVGAILLLALKWFKVSHVMKFHHLGQLLLDSNCLLLILKMFGLQEVSVSVASKHDSPENNFFRYCQTRSAVNQPARRLEDILNVKPATRSIIRGPNGEEEVELLTDFSWRNFFSSINYVKIMQKLSKHRSHRIWLLVQYKSSAILKRILKVQHPLLQLHVLKLIKSQVPYCGRKWRQSNMKVITSIYLHCRPDLRDEWLTGSEVDDMQDALQQEQALRKLVKFYNNKRYGPSTMIAANRESHKRSASLSVPLEGLHPGPELSAILRPMGTPNHVEADVFPPPRAQAPDPSAFLPYATEDIAFEEEYEEYLSDLSRAEGNMSDVALFGGTSAWHRLPHIGDEIADGISDSESIASIGDLSDARLDVGTDSDRESVDENRNNWEHMSPKTMAALPKSPVGGHRRSSSGSSLRPVLPFGLDDTSAIDLEDDSEEPEPGPIPREQSGPFAQGASVDEVEYAYGL